MNDKLIKAALRIAKNYPVFPTNDKRPCWSNAEYSKAFALTEPLKRGEGGYKIAIQDPDMVRKLFEHPRATEIAVPMGEMSGLICIDVDLYKDPTLRAWANTLPPTLMHETRSGGLHYIYKHPGEVGILPATLRPGVDLKAGGTGYICWPGTPGYKALNRGRPKVFPMHVLEAALKAKGGTGKTPTSGAYNEASDSTLIDNIQTAADFHASLRTLSMRLVSRGTDRDDAVEVLDRIMLSGEAHNPAHSRHEDWLERYDRIGDLVDSAIDKQKVPEFSPDAVAAVMEGPSIIPPAGPPPAADIAAQAEAEPDDSLFEEYSAQLGLKETIPPIDWMIPGMVPHNTVTSLAGTSGVGKTRWLAGLAVSLTAGDTARMGLPQCDAAVPVMWVANEEVTVDIRRRLKAVTLQYGDKRTLKVYVRGTDKAGGTLRLIQLVDGQPVINWKLVSALAVEALQRGVKLLILDPYITLAAGGDENSTTVADLLTEVFWYLINTANLTVLHAHHTPKDRSKAGDWYRGSPDAWRGSGAIYSGLGGGLTLSQWWPGAEKKKRWASRLLSDKLGRWVVLDSGKVRDAVAPDPVVYEMLGQDMQDGEGEPIAIMRLSSEDEAEACLNQGAIDAASARAVVEAIYARWSDVTEVQGTDVHKELMGLPGWPVDAQKLQARHHQILIEIFGQPMVVEGVNIQYVLKGSGKAARYVWTITE